MYFDVDAMQQLKQSKILIATNGRIVNLKQFLADNKEVYRWLDHVFQRAK